jgi:hypothetical protein
VWHTAAAALELRREMNAQVIAWANMLTAIVVTRARRACDLQLFICLFVGLFVGLFVFKLVFYCSGRSAPASEEDTHAAVCPIEKGRIACTRAVPRDGSYAILISSVRV